MVRTTTKTKQARKLPRLAPEILTDARDEPRYVMSVAARLVELSPQAIRASERAGLLTPARSSGRQRLYSERDLERLRRIKTLVADMGLNMAGVEVALRLMDRVAELEEQLQKGTTPADMR